jgi:hypothetical protein
LDQALRGGLGTLGDVPAGLPVKDAFGHARFQGGIVK